jgi:preprotein translocase subunit SecE
VARNRQRAKERQARRRAQEDARGDGADGREALGRDPDAPQAEPDVARAEPEPVEPDAAERVEPDAAERVEPDAAEPEPTPEEIELRAGAPPEDVGRSDEVLDYEQDLDSLEDEDEHYDPAEDEAEDDVAPTTRGPRGRRGDAKPEHKDRPRFVQFLYAVVAELRRVQWPDRQTLTTLTGVVLGFVLIAGGYLGLLDAIFSRIINAIL